MTNAESADVVPEVAQAENGPDPAVKSRNADDSAAESVRRTDRLDSGSYVRPFSAGQGS